MLLFSGPLYPLWSAPDLLLPLFLRSSPRRLSWAIHYLQFVHYCHSRLSCSQIHKLWYFYKSIISKKYQSHGIGCAPIALKDQYFDLPGLNAYSCIPVPTLRDYIKRDGLPYFKLRGKILVRRSEFDAWVNSHRVDSIDKWMLLGAFHISIWTLNALSQSWIQ